MELVCGTPLTWSNPHVAADGDCQGGPRWLLLNYSDGWNPSCSQCCFKTCKRHISFNPILRKMRNNENSLCVLMISSWIMSFTGMRRLMFDRFTQRGLTGWRPGVLRLPEDTVGVFPPVNATSEGLSARSRTIYLKKAPCVNVNAKICI